LALAAGHHLQTESFSSTFGEVSASVATRATMKLPMAKRDPGPPARRVRPSFFRGKQF
jgi:hypothetical protein